MEYLIGAFEQTTFSEPPTWSIEYSRRALRLGHRARYLSCGRVHIWMEWTMGNESTGWTTRLRILGLFDGSQPFREINQTLGPGDTYNGRKITENYILECMKEIRHCLVETFLAHSSPEFQIHMAAAFLETFWFGKGWCYLWASFLEDQMPSWIMPVGYKRIIPSDHLGVITKGTGKGRYAALVRTNEHGDISPFIGDDIRRWPLQGERTFGLAMQHDYLAPISSMSGWAPQPQWDPFFSISGDVYTEKTRKFCQALGFNLLEQPTRDRGEPGRYQACHAEMQLWTYILEQYYELGVDGHWREVNSLLHDFQTREMKILVTQKPCPECVRFMTCVCDVFEFRLDVVSPTEASFKRGGTGIISRHVRYDLVDASSHLLRISIAPRLFIYFVSAFGANHLFELRRPHRNLPLSILSGYPQCGSSYRSCWPNIICCSFPLNICPVVPSSLSAINRIYDWIIFD